MINYTPTVAAKAPSTSPVVAPPKSGFTPYDAGSPPPVIPPAAPKPYTTTAGVTIVPGSTLSSNLKALPGQLWSAAKSIFSAPVAAGEDIAGAIVGAPTIDTTQIDASTKLLQQHLSQLRAAGQGQSPRALAIVKVLSQPNNIPSASDINPILNKSNEQIVGDFAGTAADILTAGSLDLGAKAALTPAKTVLEGALRGAAAGAKQGGFIGAVQAFSGALQQDKSTSDVIKSTIAGGAEGAAAGGVAGGILGTFTTKIPKTPEEKLQASIEMTKPTLNKNASIAAMENAGRPGGVSAAGGLESSPRDIAVAKSVQDVVTPGNPIDTLVNINGKIENVAQNEVRPVLQQNPSAFNLPTLNAYIRDNVTVPNYIKSDPVLQKTYDLTRESMIEEASQNSKTLEGLWDSRISFDHVADRQIGPLDPTSDKVAVIKQAVLDTRRAVNNFIAENLQQTLDSKAASGQIPAGTVQNFTSNMRLMNQMYEARGNIATTHYKLLNSSNFWRWVALNPGKVKALQTGAGLTGLGIVGHYVGMLEGIAL